MADDESTTVAEDTSVEEATDTSTNDEAQDTDVDLEDIEVNLKDIEDTDDETEESEDSEDEEEDTEPENTDEDSEEDEQELSDEDKQKAFNKEMAERRIQAKQQRELDQKAQQEEYLTQAEDEKDLALRQLQVDAYNNKVEANTNKLTNGYERALKDFDILNSTDPAVKDEVDAALDAFQAQAVKIDAYGNPIDVRGDLYAYLQRKAESIEKLTGIGARQQTKNKAKEKSKTLTTPSRSPKEPKIDPDLAAFDEEASKY